MDDAITYQPDGVSYPAAGRRVRRSVAIGSAVIFLLTGWWWIPMLAGRIEAVAYRQECMSYQAPEDLVVFEEDPLAVRQLTDQPGYESTVGGRLRWVPPFWLQESPGLRTQGTVFLHSLTSPNGHTRLVGVDVTVDPGMYLSTTGNVEDMTLAATVIIPAGGVRSDKFIHMGECAMWVCPINPRPMRFFAGKVDLQDPAHFTFDYKRLNTRGTIDGRLNDDDTVTLTPRLGTTNHSRLPVLWEPDGQP